MSEPRKRAISEAAVSVTEMLNNGSTILTSNNIRPIWAMNSCTTLKNTDNESITVAIGAMTDENNHSLVADNAKCAVNMRRSEDINDEIVYIRTGLAKGGIVKLRMNGTTLRKTLNGSAYCIKFNTPALANGDLPYCMTL